MKVKCKKRFNKVYLWKSFFSFIAHVHQFYQTLLKNQAHANDTATLKIKAITKKKNVLRFCCHSDLYNLYRFYWQQNCNTFFFRDWFNFESGSIVSKCLIFFWILVLIYYKYYAYFTGKLLHEGINEHEENKIRKHVFIKILVLLIDLSHGPRLHHFINFKIKNVNSININITFPSITSTISII